MNYDVIIVGAGPGGTFAAYELTKTTQKLKWPCLNLVTPLKNAIAQLTVKRLKAVLIAKPVQ